MMSYFGLILAFAMRYQKFKSAPLYHDIPYSITYLVGWVILFYVWVFALDFRWARNAYFYP